MSTGGWIGREWNGDGRENKIIQDKCKVAAREWK